MASPDYYSVSPPSDDSASSCSPGQMSSAYEPRPKSPPRIQTNTQLGTSEPSSPSVALSLSSNEKSRIVAIMAIELLAFEGKPHSGRTNWSCPFADCKDNFPTAKDLMRHVLDCERFSSQGLFCNMCNGYDCFETHELSTSSSHSTQKRALGKFKKMFKRSKSPHLRSLDPEETQRVSSPQNRGHTVSPSSSMSGKSASRGSVFESPRQIKMQSPSPVHSPDLSSGPSEMGGNPVSELDGLLIRPELEGLLIRRDLDDSLIPQELDDSLMPQELDNSLIPQELPDLVHQPQMLPNIEIGPDQDVCNHPTQHEIPGFQPLVHDASMDFCMEDDMSGYDSFNAAVFLARFPHHDAGRETPAQNFGSQEDQADVNFMYQNNMSNLPTELSTKQLAHSLSLEIGSLDRYHQTSSQDSSSPNDSPPNLGSQSPVGNRMSQRPHISIQVGQLTGDPWPLPLSAKPTLMSPPSLSPPSSASQSQPSSATTFSPFTPVSHRAHQFNMIPESPITHVQQDDQILECPHCDYYTKGENTGSYPTYFKKHLETHGDNKFPCLGCGKLLKRKDNLNVHMRDHCPSLRTIGGGFASLQVTNGLLAPLPNVGETLSSSMKDRKSRGLGRQPRTRRRGRRDGVQAVSEGSSRNSRMYVRKHIGFSQSQAQ